MDGLEPGVIDPNDLPEGFKTQDPHGGGSSNNASAQKQQMQEQHQAVLQQALTPDALARLNRIKIVKQGKAQVLENAIVSMAMSGKLQGQINEGKLIEMLERGSAKDARASSSINFQRKKYSIDSDDEEDDDDV
jgi:programmed cell death protein 5